MSTKPYLREASAHGSFNEHMARTAGEYLRALLSRNAGNVALAAREAGLNRTYLHELMRRFGIQGRGRGGGNEMWRAMQ